MSSRWPAGIIRQTPVTPTGPAETGAAPGMWRMDEVAYWAKQGVWPTAGVTKDPYYSQVSFLLSTTVLNNANNNLFVDSSSMFNPIARNGDTGQGSFSPYSPYWSNYFDGSGDFLSVPDNAALDFETGNFTVEMWVYFPATVSTNNALIAGWTTGEPVSGWVVGADATGFYFVSAVSTVYSTTAVNTAARTPGVWHHVAVVRSSGSVTVYVNGVGGTPVSNTQNITTAATGLNIGRSPYTANPSPFTGYISNLRIVKGTAVYTSNFTPPTTPLTAISGTSLLTCQSNRFRDASTNNFTVTPNGDTRVMDFSPFTSTNPDIGYNPNDITNWSGYFDGSGDYLSLGDNTALQMGSGDFTTEFWWYPVSLSGFQTPFEKGYTGSGGLLLQTGNGDGRIIVYASGSAVITASTAPTVGAWNHMALVRSGTSLVLYLNGVSVGSATNSTNFNNTGSAGIGANVSGGGAGAYPINGYMSNLRVVKGTAVYTGTFTPPTTNLTAISGTSLLTLQNAAFTDNSSNNFGIGISGNTTATGNSPFNTAGYWSNYFDGSGDYLTSSGTTLGAGNFTVEAWVYLTSLPNTQNALFSFGSGDGINSGVWYITNTGTLGFYASFSIFGSSTAIPLNQWVHLALTRTGISTTQFINGTADGNGAVTRDFSATPFQIFRGFGTPTNGPAGYISNVRVVNGTNLYPTNFTPPTTPPTAVSGTTLLTCQSGQFVDNSGNNYAITRYGDVRVRNYNPFYAPTISRNGGSMYFDGNGDTLYLSSNPAFSISTPSTPFTIEAWIYPRAAGGCIFSEQWTGINNIPITLAMADGSSIETNGRYVTLGVYNGSAWALTRASQQVPLNAWTHVAAVFIGNTSKIFYNGVDVTAASPITSWPITGQAGDGWYIGQRWDTAGNPYFNGYISSFRFVNGEALYVSNFTPPTTPLTNTPNTVLLPNGMNAGVYDATAINDVQTIGNARVNTNVSKFGGSSVYFDGTADYAIAPSSDAFGYGTGDFTIEFWLYLDAAVLQTVVSNLSGAAGTSPHLYMASDGSIRYYTAAADRIVGSILSTGTWYHIAVSRASGSTKLFINGNQSGSTYADSNNYTTPSPLGIGTYLNGTSPVTTNTLYGYIDDLRVTKGVARYTTNFTPPTKAFPTF